jgi:small subunit ribosomal protein S6
MRRYETITIIDPDLSEEERKPVLDRISELIPQQDGFLVMIDEWGSKKLAYDIKRKSRGYYVRFDFCGTGTLLDEMERFFRIDDRVLKYMTVLLEKDADIESIKEEVAKAESEAKQAALSSEPETEPIPEEIVESETEPEAGSEAEPEAGSDAGSKAGSEAGSEDTETPDTVTDKDEKES